MQCQVATLYEDEALYYVHVHSIQGCFKKYAGDIQHAKNILVNRLKVLAHIKGEVVNSQKLFFLYFVFIHTFICDNCIANTFEVIDLYVVKYLNF